MFALYLSVRQQRCLPWRFIGRDASSSAQGCRYRTFKEHTVEWMIERMNELMNERTNEQTDGWMDE